MYDIMMYAEEKKKNIYINKVHFLFTPLILWQFYFIILKLLIQWLTI